jgi:cell division protein FtsN
VHALPENADLPYFGGGNGGEVAQDTSSEVDFTLAVIGEGDDSTVAEPSEPDSTPLQQENTPEESHTQIPEEAQDLRGTKVVKAAPRAAQRRAESRVNWNSALDHKGSFHVHVSSFRDSARALLAQEREGFSELPVRLHPVDVEGRTWYRVLVGEFPDLLSAAAFRDSLLDQAGRDFCVIGIDPEP